tara:strand:+ start:516 stop:1712 length:1197 start_codon:yes stop_codon:yes gene_type:complete
VILNQYEEIILDLNNQPVSNRFLYPNEENNVPSFAMELVLDKSTGIIKLKDPFPIEELKPHYDWLTCFEPEDHLDSLVEKIIKLPGISINSTFAGYSFKDDSTLERLKVKGYKRQWRIDPKNDLNINDTCASVETFQSVFNLKKALQIRKRHGPVDVFIVRHVLEHAYDLSEFISAIDSLITDEGYIVWEIPDCENALTKGDCTIIWEEHTYYFTSFTFKHFLEKSGFTILDYESEPYPLENSIIAITKKNNKNDKVSSPSKEAIEKECERAYQYVQKFNTRREVVNNKLKKYKEKNGNIAMFGAGHLAIAFISLMGITEMIDFVIDDNPNKIGMKLPIGDIKILGSNSLFSKNISLCLLSLNPQNQPKLIEKHSNYTESGGTFASIFPGSSIDIDKI